MENCSVEARVNDIAVLRKNDLNIVTMARPIHEYLLNGRNTLSLQVRPFKNAFSANSKVHLRVAAFQSGDFLEFDGGHGLAEIQFVINKEEAQQTERTQQHANFNLSWATQWNWSIAPKLTLDDTLKQHLDQFLTQTYNEFSSQQPDKLMKLQKPYYLDLEQCYPTGGLRLREQEFKEYITKQRAYWDVVPLDLEQTNYQLAANGRLVECVGSDGLPVIRTQVDDLNAPNKTNGYVAFPMHIGLLDNTLKILR